MKKDISSIVWGLVIIIIGISFLGDTCKWWDMNIFFNGWWTLLIIIPSIIDIFTKHTYFSSGVCFIIGILLLLGCQDIISWHSFFDIFVPALIIMVGLIIIFKPNFKKVSKGDRKSSRQYIGIFSGCAEKIVDSLTSARCTAVFGGVELDLTDLKIEQDITIDCLSVFGGIDIKVPQDVKIKSVGVPVFGGLENKASQKIKDGSKTIYINYVCVFGGIEIK